MGIKLRITVLNFLEFFAWGAWLISLGGYMINTLHFTGGQVGSIYATMGIASLFMPALLGIVADRWINAERVMGLSHIILAILLFWVAQVKTYDNMYWIMLLISMMYMPTIAMDNTVSYSILEQKGYLKRRPAEGRAYVYQSARPRKQIIKDMVQEFVNRVFNGSAEPLMVQLVKDRHLSRADIEKIASAIEEGQ